MKSRIIKSLLALSVFALCSSANALVVVDYDLSTAGGGTAGTTKAPTTVVPGYSASSIVLTNPDNTVGGLASNHFYHDGWDTTFNAGKYYETTISGVNPFTFSSARFSLEELSGSPSTYWMRSSLDGFASDIATGMFGNGLVTLFNVDLSTLGLITAPISFRWYMTADNLTERAGFANHEIGGLGGGLSDTGVDVQFRVPEPATIALLGLGLAGLGFRKRK